MSFLTQLSLTPVRSNLSSTSGCSPVATNVDDSQSHLDGVSRIGDVGAHRFRNLLRPAWVLKSSLFFSLLQNWLPAAALPWGTTMMVALLHPFRGCRPTNIIIAVIIIIKITIINYSPCYYNEQVQLVPAISEVGPLAEEAHGYDLDDHLEREEDEDHVVEDLQ